MNSRCLALIAFALLPLFSGCNFFSQSYELDYTSNDYPHVRHQMDYIRSVADERGYVTKYESALLKNSVSFCRSEAESLLKAAEEAEAESGLAEFLNKFAREAGEAADACDSWLEDMIASGRVK